MVAGLLAVSFCSPFHVNGQTWTQTIYGYWYSIASSADGSRLFATEYYGDIYSSTNGGQRWNPTGAPGDRAWVAIASSADGATLIAAAQPHTGPAGAVFVSHDLGATWAQAVLPAYFWGLVASSADGHRLVTVGSTAQLTWPYTNVIYVSSDSGGSWALSDAPNEFWNGVASSADGLRLAVTGSNGTWTSTNGGLNWNPTTTPFGGLSVAVSGDGTTLIVLNHGSVAVSHDWGADWITNSTMPNPTYQGTPKVASSVDGTLLAALPSGTTFDIEALISTNAGLSWSNSQVCVGGWTNPCCIASSADGRKVAVAIHYSGIFTYQTTPAPVLNLVSSGDNIVLSWIVPSKNFVLQQSSDLSAWSPLGVTPVLNYTNLHYEVTVLRTGDQRFYRLASP
jgi:hypothetical protein